MHGGRHRGRVRERTPTLAQRQTILDKLIPRVYEGKMARRLILKSKGGEKDGMARSRCHL